MISFSAFSKQSLTPFLQQQQQMPFSYPEVGATREAHEPAGYDNDYNQVLLGSGPETWHSAKKAIEQWRMFPGTWARIYPADAPIRKGQTVAMCAQVMGIWWRNACRIVYTIDEPNRFGFAYGTLPGHVETGEELFLVERNEQDQVWYSIRAFSRPRFWLVRLAYPIARRYQRRFVRDSQLSMSHAAAE